MRFYNYNTGRLYESNGTYSIRITETPLAEDVYVNPEETECEVEEKFYSDTEAKDVIEQMIDELCENEEFTRDDADIVYTDNGVIVTVPNFKEWTFTVVGDIDESKSSRRRNRLGESVSTKFSRLRSMYEEAGLDEDDENSEEDNDDQDKNSDDNGEESQELTAVVISVKKGDEDKCKEELIDAGIDEDDIEILSENEDDEEEVEIRINADSIMALKDYLDKKGIDLEKEVGGEIVDDSEGNDDDSDDDGDEDKEGEEGKNGDDKDFDFNDLGDLFGSEEGEE